MGVGGPTNRQNNMNTHQKTILVSETRKKTLKYTFQTWQNIFFQNLSWWIFIRHTISTRLQLEKNGFENIFFSEISPVQPLLVKMSRKRFFLLTGAKCKGYDFFFRKCTGWLLLSILISMKSPLQILFFENFNFQNFYQFPPYHELHKSNQYPS